MFKGAVLLFAFSLFFPGCQSKPIVQTPPPPAALPVSVLHESPKGLPPESEQQTIEQYPKGWPEEPEVTSSGPIEDPLTNIEEPLAKRDEEASNRYAERAQEKELGIAKEIMEQEVVQIEGDVETKEEPKEIEKEEEIRGVAPPSIETMEIPPGLADLPDLTLTHLYLLQKRRVTVILSNTGVHPFSMADGNLTFFVDGRFEKNYPLRELSVQALLSPKESVTLATPLTLYGRHEVEARIDIGTGSEELTRENNRLKKMLEGLPMGPDIVIGDLNLTEDMGLSILLFNNGEIDLRKGVTFRVRIFLNDRKISEFDHFTSEMLRAQSGSLYVLEPPYRVNLKGIFNLKVSVEPKRRSDDIRFENNVFERRFIIFPFQVRAGESEAFSYTVPFRAQRQGESKEKVRIELRWGETDNTLNLSFTGSGDTKELPTVSGKSPLRIEFPMAPGEPGRESLWKVSVANPRGKRVEGHLIIQHP